MERHVGDERLRQVAEGPHPRLIMDPAELAVIVLSRDPDAETTGIAQGVVFGANVGKYRSRMWYWSSKFTSNVPFPMGRSRGIASPPSAI